MALDVTVTCDAHVLTGEDCEDEFYYNGSVPQAPVFGPFLASGWVPFTGETHDWSFRQHKDYGWITLCPQHADLPPEGST